MAIPLRISAGYRMSGEPISAVLAHGVYDVDRMRKARNSLPPKIKALVRDPDHDTVHGLAGSLAKPVVRGWMRSSEAYASIGLAALKLPDGAEHLEEFWQTFRNHVAWHVRHREQTFEEIQVRLRPFIRMRAKRNVLLAEAHGVNGSAGFPFAEEEIRPIVVAEVWLCLPPAPWRRHAR